MLILSIDLPAPIRVSIERNSRLPSRIEAIQEEPGKSRSGTVGLRSMEIIFSIFIALSNFWNSGRRPLLLDDFNA